MSIHGDEWKEKSQIGKQFQEKCEYNAVPCRLKEAIPHLCMEAWTQSQITKLKIQSYNGKAKYILLVLWGLEKKIEKEA